MWYYYGVYEGAAEAITAEQSLSYGDDLEDGDSVVVCSTRQLEVTEILGAAARWDGGEVSEDNHGRGCGVLVE
jgi:hypothetical protein